MSAVEADVREEQAVAIIPAPQRAALALRSTETAKKLAELAQVSKTIVVVTNKDGREQAHGAMMALKAARIEIEKTGKEARDDATKFGKAVIAEEARLIGLIEPEEARLKKLRDGWDAEQERIKQAAIDAEKARVAKLQDRILFIRNYPARHAGRSSILLHIATLELSAIVVDEEAFEEWAPTARAAKEEAVTLMTQMHWNAVDREDKERAEADARIAEEARLAGERKRLEAERIEQERVRKEQEAKLAAEREDHEARIAAERKAIEEGKAELRRQKEELDTALKAAETPIPAPSVPFATPATANAEFVVDAGPGSLSVLVEEEAIGRRKPEDHELETAVISRFAVSRYIAACWLRGYGKP